LSFRDHLAARIRAEGPIPLAEAMAAALTHPTLGYYTTRDPLGAAGDFTTAPEISQMFGELIGLWSAVVWQSMGAPDRIALVELGPGRGTLMADLLRAARLVPGFLDAIEIHLVEASRPLREAQADSLAGQRPRWHDDLSDLPQQPTILIANEFFDALPIAQLVRRREGWRERCVGLDAEGSLTWTEARGPSPFAALLDRKVAESSVEGAIAELCPAGIGIAASVAGHLARHGGAALAIDYGHGASAVGDTLQAVQRHRYSDVLATLGEADLTAHVDFAALGRAVTEAGGRVHGPRTQGDWLRALGIEARADALCRTATPDQANDIRRATRRLIGETEMGRLFKVAAWTAPTLPTPPGF